MSSQNQSSVLHKSKDILFSTMSSEELLSSMDSFDAREDDVFLVSYPKSGTDWIAKVIENISNTEITLTSPTELGDISKFEELTMCGKRRVIPTHLSYNMLPVDIKQKQCKVPVMKQLYAMSAIFQNNNYLLVRGAQMQADLAMTTALRPRSLYAHIHSSAQRKIIYIVRNPKDTAVSLFHYYRESPNLPGVETWASFLELFLRGDVVYGSWFDHILTWEDHENDKNILFIFYEEMKKDPSKSIKKITTFLGINVSEREINQIAWKSSFREMKNDAAKENCDPNKTICANRGLVFRIGAVGDWINYFTSKQKRVFDELFAERMKHSELARHFEDYS